MANKQDAPICPYCKKPMYIMNYVGYYENFPHWMCECDEDFLETKAEHEWYGDNS